MFTTDSVPEKDRFAAWREDISALFDVEELPVKDEKPFHATFHAYHFGQSVVGDLKATGGRYLRSSLKVARDGMDAILLQLFVEGGIEGGVQCGVGNRRTGAVAGDIVVFDLGQSLDTINSDYHAITILWQRQAMEQVIPEIARWHGHALPPGNPSLDLLRRHILSCRDLAPRFSMEEARRMEEATLALVAGAMAGNTVPADPASAVPFDGVLTYQIKRYIRENLGASDLSPRQIAQRFGISRTQLYALLEPLGGIARYNLRLRLQRCLADLQNPAQAHYQIAEIAYRWGFSNLGTFNRNFRKTFAATPGEARTQALGGKPLLPLTAPSSLSQHGTRDHHRWFQAIGL